MSLIAAVGARIATGLDALGTATSIRARKSFVRETRFVDRAGEAIGNLRRRERAVDERGRQAARGQRVDLVLHERDERRDHHRQLREHERRYLVAERFAAAGRQDDERVAPREDRLDRRFLSRTECRIAEVIRECRSRVQDRLRWLRRHRLKLRAPRARATTR